MKAGLSKWRIAGYLLISLCFLLLSQASSDAAETILNLRINSVASVVHTSGGISGGGMGNLSISGTVQAVVKDGVIEFHTIDVTTSPADAFSSGIIPGFPGIIARTSAGFSFSGSKPYDNATGGGDFSGTISGAGFTLNGTVNAPCCDQYNYEFVLNGTIVCHDETACTTDTFDPAAGTCIHIPTAFCIDSINNNFTMLDDSGALLGGADDVRFTWDGTKKTSVECPQVPNATLSSSSLFLGHIWSAHDVAIYGPGTYTVYRDCPAGCPGCGKGTPITFAVGPGEIGLHVLLNWNTAKDIDLVNVLAPNSAFGPSPLWTDASHATPADKIWNWMSKDWTGNGINGMGISDEWHTAGTK